MRYILIALIALIVSSCSLEKRCAKMDKKCPRETVIQVKDSFIYREIIEVHDSIIEIKLPADTIRINKYVYVDHNNLAQLDTVIVDEGMIEAWAWVTDSKLGLVCFVRDSSLFHQLDSARIEITKIKESYHTENTETNYTIKENTWFANMCIWWFWICIIAVASIIIYKYRKQIRKLIFRV